MCDREESNKGKIFVSLSILKDSKEILKYYLSISGCVCERIHIIFTRFFNTNGDTCQKLSFAIFFLYFISLVWLYTVCSICMVVYKVESFS